MNIRKKQKARIRPYIGTPIEVVINQYHKGNDPILHLRFVGSEMLLCGLQPGKGGVVLAGNQDPMRVQCWPCVKVREYLKERGCIDVVHRDA